MTTRHGESIHLSAGCLYLLSIVWLLDMERVFTFLQGVCLLPIVWLLDMERVFTFLQGVCLLSIVWLLDMERVFTFLQGVCLLPIVWLLDMERVFTFLQGVFAGCAASCAAQCANRRQVAGLHVTSPNWLARYHRVCLRPACLPHAVIMATWNTGTSKWSRFIIIRFKRYMYVVCKPLIAHRA